jgi:hypothetical protein
MTRPVVTSRAVRVAVAALLCLLTWPAAALADGLIRPTQTVTQTVSGATGTLGDAVGDATGQLADVSDPITQATQAVVSITVDTLSAVAGSTSGQSSQPGATESSSSSNERSATVSTASRSPSSASNPQSSRALISAGAAGLAPTGPFALYQSFAPPPPRYGGLNEALANTGTNLMLPLTVLMLLLSIAVVAKGTDEVRRRYRTYGALRYRGRHRMPPRRRLRLAPAAV